MDNAWLNSMDSDHCVEWLLNHPEARLLRQSDPSIQALNGQDRDSGEVSSSYHTFQSAYDDDGVACSEAGTPAGLAGPSLGLQGVDNGVSFSIERTMPSMQKLSESLLAIHGCDWESPDVADNVIDEFTWLNNIYTSTNLPTEFFGDAPLPEQFSDLSNLREFDSSGSPQEQVTPGNTNNLPDYPDITPTDSAPTRIAGSSEPDVLSQQYHPSEASPAFASGMDSRPFMAEKHSTMGEDRLTTGAPLATGPTVQKAKVTSFNWEAWRPVLRRLYIDQGLTLAELADEMKIRYGVDMSIGTYSNHFTKWRDFRKNKTGRQGALQATPNRRRKAKSLTKRRAGRPLFSFALSIRMLNVPAPPILSQHDNYNSKMLHAIDCLVNGSFDLGSRTQWTWNEITFLPVGLPARGSIGRIDPWEMVYNQCLILVVASKIKTGKIISRLFGGVLTALDQAAMAGNDPRFLLYIWRCCVALEDIHVGSRKRLKRFVFLWVFLQRLKAALQAAFPNVRRDGREHDLVMVSDCLLKALCTSPLNFKSTLREGCEKTLRIMGRVIPPSHLTRLALAFFCKKTWPSVFGTDTNFEADANLARARYKALVDMIDFHRPGERDVSLLHDYMAALSHRRFPLGDLDTDGNVPQRVDALREITNEVSRTFQVAQVRIQSERTNRQGRLHLGLTARVLALSSDLLTNCRKTAWEIDRKTASETGDGPLDECFALLGNAAELLRTGDVGCQIMAAQLYRKQAMFYRAFRPGEKNPSRRGIRGLGQQEKEAELRVQTIMERVTEPQTATIGQSFLGLAPRDRPPRPNHSERKRRWRDNKKRDVVLVMSSLAEMAQLRDGLITEFENKVLNSKPDGPNSKHTRIVRKPGPYPTKSTLPVEKRTCAVCGHIAESRNALMKHIDKIHGLQ